MITDAEQKLYRVLFHLFVKNRQMPSWTELQAKTGLPKPELVKRIQRLQEAGDLLWANPDSLASLSLCRDPFIKPRQPSPDRMAVNYFTDY